MIPWRATSDTCLNVLRASTSPDYFELASDYDQSVGTNIAKYQLEISYIKTLAVYLETMIGKINRIRLFDESLIKRPVFIDVRAKTLSTEFAAFFFIDEMKANSMRTVQMSTDIHRQCD